MEEETIKKEELKSFLDKNKDGKKYKAELEKDRINYNPDYESGFNACLELIEDSFL